MSNFIYTAALTDLMTANLDLVDDTLKLVLCTSGYSAAESDEYLSDIAAGYRVATATLIGKSVVAAVFDASNITFSALTGSVVTQGVLYKDTGNPATSRLIYRISDYPGLPLTPDGNDVLWSWPNDGNKIFRFRYSTSS